jgi:hypothetical protein
MHRIGIVLSVALPLAALDLWVKATQHTEPWAYHARSYGWLALSLGVLLAMLLIAQVPSMLVAPAAGILAAGVIGNGLSAAWNHMEVPNPLVIDSEHAIIAFNLADVWAVTGICLLMLALGTWLIRNRHLIPPTDEVRSSRGRAFQRLLQQPGPVRDEAPQEIGH